MRPDEAAPGDGAAFPAKLLDFQPIFDAVLPPDWVLLGRCRVGTGEAPGGCFVLAHPEVGVALVDLLPIRTRNAEAQLRRLLNAVDFSATCRGYLPIIHCEVGPDDLNSLRARIEDGFAYDSVLTIGGRGRWVGVLRRTLQAGVTWEALGGRPATARTGGMAGLRGFRPMLRLARAGLVGCGMLGLFGLGFASALLLPPTEPIRRQGFPSAGAVADYGQASVPVTPAAAVPMPTLPAARPLGAEEPPAASFGAGNPEYADAPPAEAADAAAEPMGETRTAALVPAARRPARVPLPIDRRCSDAVFRFQQGASLSSQEMAHVRQGCASWR